jgi:hypothetical protein
MKFHSCKENNFMWYLLIEILNLVIVMFSNITLLYMNYLNNSEFK